MKSKLLMGIIALSILIHPLYAQEPVSREEKKTQINAIDTAIKRLQRFKGCLQGKEPCSKLDFAALGATLLFVHGVITAARSRLLGPTTITKEGKPGQWPLWKKNVYRLTTIADPNVHGYLLFQKSPRRVNN